MNGVGAILAAFQFTPPLIPQAHTHAETKPGVLNGLSIIDTHSSILCEPRLSLLHMRGWIMGVALFLGLSTPGVILHSTSKRRSFHLWYII